MLSSTPNNRNLVKLVIYFASEESTLKRIKRIAIAKKAMIAIFNNSSQFELLMSP
jgi:hypothetical protein